MIFGVICNKPIAADEDNEGVEDQATEIPPCDLDKSVMFQKHTLFGAEGR